MKDDKYYPFLILHFAIFNEDGKYPILIVASLREAN